MKLVKKTAQYSIYQRGDDRYAVKDVNKKPVNGAEKVRILSVEELIKIVLPAKPAVVETITAEVSAATDSPDAVAAKVEDAVEE